MKDDTTQAAIRSEEQIKKNIASMITTPVFLRDMVSRSKAHEMCCKMWDEAVKYARKELAAQASAGFDKDASLKAWLGHDSDVSGTDWISAQREYHERIRAPLLAKIAELEKEIADDFEDGKMIIMAALGAAKDLEQERDAALARVKELESK